jgi:hypothetical protein
MKKGCAAPVSLGKARGGSHVPVKRVGAASDSAGTRRKKKKKKPQMRKRWRTPEPGREKGAL